MNRLKSNLTRSICPKIFKTDQIDLPSTDCICQEHSLEKNKIKCEKNIETKDKDPKSDELIQKELNTQIKSNLSNEDIQLKQRLEESFRVFYEIYEDFHLAKNKLDLECHNHFQEIRFQIDLHREKLKEKIDDIALEMIDQTKKFENLYLKSLNEKLDASLKLFDTKLFEKTVRDANTLIQTLREIQIKQEKHLEDLRLKLNEMNDVKDHLERSNEFQPFFALNQSSFGSLDMCVYSSHDMFKSHILIGKQPLELIRLCEFSSSDEWSLLYRGSRDGFGAEDFHSKCDGHSNTLTLLKAKNSSFIFGGYASVSWHSLDSHVNDSNAFVFSLTNKDDQPCKMKIDASNEIQPPAIGCYSEYGPIFGNYPFDIVISTNSNTKIKSYSNLGSTFAHPIYAKGSNQAKAFLAGSYKFQLSEIEVFIK